MIYEAKQVKKLVDKMAALEQPYMELLFEPVAELDPVRYDTVEHLRSVPANVDWKPIKAGDTWGGPFQSMWLKACFTVPEEYAKLKLVLLSGINAYECMVFIDGKPTGLFNKDGDAMGGNHSIALISQRAETGTKYDIALECYAGTPCLGTLPYKNYGLSKMPDSDYVHTFESLSVCAIRDDVSDFLFNLRTANQLFLTLDENCGRRGEVLSCLMDAFCAVCQYPVDVEEKVWRNAMHKANGILFKILSVKNGSQAGGIGLVGHSHMDTAWLWTVEETKRKCARTFANALTLMDWYPEYTFIQSSALHGSWMRDYYPSIFETMKKRVADGRYEPNGAAWVEFDCNITGGEAMVRQFLLGQLFTQQEFGYISDAFWLPDAFGYNAAIPQIMKGFGIKYFLTTKMEWNESNKFPYQSFVWKGMDGSEALCHLNRLQVWPDVKTIVANFDGLPDKHASCAKLVSYGFGDGGGGPQYQMLEMAKRITDLKGCPPAKHTTVSKFMQELEKEQKNLPVWSGEMYLERFRGTLTMMHNIKRSNRKAEIALRQFEALAVFVDLNAGIKFDKSKLTDWWKVLLMNQFHDILPGTCIPEVNDIAISQNYGLIEKVEKGSKDILSSMTGNKNAVTLFNSLNWKRSGQVLLDMKDGIRGAMTQRITDVEGKSILAARLELPAMLAKTYETCSETSEGQSPFRLSGNLLETPFASVKFYKDSSITSFIDKKSGRELCRAGGVPLNTFYLAEDVPLTYDNWDIDSDIFMKMAPHMNLLSRKVICDGLLQLRIESEYKIGTKSVLKQHMVFYSDTPRVDFETVLDWHEKHQLLKVGFDVDILATTIRNEIQFGHVERPTHNNTSWDVAKNEVCNHKWSDLSEARFGVALLNDCKYGISCKGSDMRLSLIKGGCRPDPRGDEGLHRFTYSLLPHEGAFCAENVVRHAYELNIQPILASGDLVACNSICLVDAENVIIEALKPAERGEGYIVRLYECERSAISCTKIVFGIAPKEVYEADMLENRQRKLHIEDSSVTVSFRPFEIKTLLVT